jgi:hypothetical protein
MGCNCSGNCASCGGCARELVLSEQEISLLQMLGQIPFLPVARRADNMTPVCLESKELSGEEGSLVLQCLEKKGLISLDYDQPLTGADMTAYAGYPVHGSMALTARGQEVLDLLERQGISEE